MTTAFFTHPACSRHEMGSAHVESPQRLMAIDRLLEVHPVGAQLHRRQAPLADREQLALVHGRELIDFIEQHTPSRGYFQIDGDTTLNPSSWEAGRAAAGAAIAAVDAVMGGEVNNAFCSIRPPGHHATPSTAMGFCLFNNIAIAARHALTHYGLNRVALIDFDVHHGNGTEDAFEGDARVLMVSFFQHPLYPYSGAGPAAQNMCNVPVAAGTGGAAVRGLVEQIWMPALHRHRPEMLFISAGFDAHREDLIGGMALVEEDYAWLTRQIADIAGEYAQGRIVSCLEGGYNTDALARCVAAHLSVLADAPAHAIQSDAK